MSGADHAAAIREASEAISAVLRWPVDTHHIGCESRRGGECDCYAAATNAAHAGLTLLLGHLGNAEANRDQWHSATNDAAEHIAALLAELEVAREQRDEAAESLAMLRAAWNHHFETCTTLVPPGLPTIEQITAWMNAPSDTPSAADSKERT